MMPLRFRARTPELEGAVLAATYTAIYCYCMTCGEQMPCEEVDGEYVFVSRCGHEPNRPTGVSTETAE